MKAGKLTITQCPICNKEIAYRSIKRKYCSQDCYLQEQENYRKRRQEIATLRQKGASIAELSEKFGASRYNIHRMLRKERDSAP